MAFVITSKNNEKIFNQKLIKIGNQRASGVRIVSVRPSCFVEPRKATLRL